jgi:mannose-6-phosphate isomerase-like protein (cupin superfamily)
MTARNLQTFPIHLGLGATAVPQPEFPRDDRAMQWYMDYAARTEADGPEGRIVSLYTFTENWPMWEMHPNGDEVVLCMAGSMTLMQEFADGTAAQVTLTPGEYAINPAGTWHTADIHGSAQGLFITAGIGTTHRPR